MSPQVVEIVVTLPGGKRVDAQAGPFTIHTDQPREYGGEDCAPEPFTLFLASLGTCAGLYVVGFCQARSIPTEDIRIIERAEREPKTGRLARIELEVQVPREFPAHYRDAVARAAGACKVKKTLSDPPEFVLTTSVRTADATEANP